MGSTFISILGTINIALIIIYFLSIIISLSYLGDKKINFFTEIIGIITLSSLVLADFLEGDMFMGIIMSLFLIFVAIKFFTEFIATHIFVFNNTDLNKLSIRARLAIQKNQGTIIINYWAPDKCTFMYFNRFKEYKFFKIFFDLPDEFIARKEYSISENYESVIEKLQKHKIPFNKMNNPI